MSEVPSSILSSLPRRPGHGVPRLGEESAEDVRVSMDARGAVYCPLGHAPRRLLHLLLFAVGVRRDRRFSSLMVGGKVLCVLSWAGDPASDLFPGPSGVGVTPGLGSSCHRGVGGERTVCSVLQRDSTWFLTSRAQSVEDQPLVRTRREIRLPFRLRFPGDRGAEVEAFPPAPRVNT